MKNKLNVRFRIWIDKNNCPYLGIGRIVLLENIHKHGSISKGAKAINMSYRKAWQLVDDMNKLTQKPLVEKILGGNKGGRSVLTKEGKAAITNFYKLQEKIEKYIHEQTELYSF